VLLLPKRVKNAVYAVFLATILLNKYKELVTTLVSIIYTISKGESNSKELLEESLSRSRPKGDKDNLEEF
jgi:hypothetical protein